MSVVMSQNWRPPAPPRDEAARQHCHASCPTSREFSPVCGTNGVTYNNMGLLRCAMVCGESVDLHRPVPCSRNDPPATTSSPTTPRPTVTTRSYTENDELDCVRSCPSTPEYNPVCGTDRVTYNNIGKLECARYCGVDVVLWRHAPCPTPISTTTVAPTTNQELDLVMIQCINRCPATSQYNPVCGTDNVTYSNTGKLECAKSCGVDVSQLYPWPCSYTPNTTERPIFEKLDPPTEIDYGEDTINPRFPGPNSQRRLWN